MTGAVPVRPTARVLLLDPDDRVLMLRVHDEVAARGPNPIPADFWLLVGGGVRSGESWEEAARREVREETGIRDVAIGRCVWTQDKVVATAYGEVWRVVGRYLVARVPAGTRVDFGGHEPLEASTIIGYRWFTHADVLARERIETFLPYGFGALLGDVLAGVHKGPVAIGA